MFCKPDTGKTIILFIFKYNGIVIIIELLGWRIDCIYEKVLFYFL